MKILTKTHPKKALSFALVFFFFAANLPQGLAETASVPADLKFPRDPAKIELPQADGKIEESFKGGSPQTVILLRDAHSNPDAQENTRKIIRHFQARYGVRRIGVEGASGPLDGRLFASFPDKAKLARVLADYAARGELTGVNAAVLLNEHPADYEGLEDWGLYLESLSLYRRAMAERPRLSKEMEEEERKLQAEKEKHYSPRLLEIDTALRDFHANRGDLGIVLKKLGEVRRPLKGSSLEMLLEEIESKKGVWGKDELKREKRYSHINTAFLGEFKGYAESVKGSLFRSEKERGLNRKGHELDLLKRLAALELHREDWIEIKKETSDKRRVTGVASFVTRHLPQHLSFYLNTEKRDQVLFANLLKWQGRENAILVAGGFHTEAIAALLKEKNISYAVVRPEIKEIPREDFYRSQMGGDFSWKNYFETADGGIDLHKAFLRAVRDRLLEGTSDKRHVTGNASPLPGHLSLLKRWRDQLIRDLASAGEIENARKYLVFLDEAQKKEDGPGASGLKEEWLRNIHAFIERFRLLQSEDKLTEQNLLDILKPASTPSLASAVLSPRAGIRADFFDPRSEMRKEKSEEESERKIRVSNVSELFQPDYFYEMRLPTQAELESNSRMEITFFYSLEHWEKTTRAVIAYYPGAELVREGHLEIVFSVPARTAFGGMLLNAAVKGRAVDPELKPGWGESDRYLDTFQSGRLDLGYGVGTAPEYSYPLTPTHVRLFLKEAVERYLSNVPLNMRSGWSPQTVEEGLSRAIENLQSRIPDFLSPADLVEMTDTRAPLSAEAGKQQGLLMDFAAFMDDANRVYYEDEVRFGEDFQTPGTQSSGEVGETFAIYAFEKWKKMGRPANFRVGEIGGGNGSVAAAFLNWISSQIKVQSEDWIKFSQELEFVHLDRSQSLLNQQSIKVRKALDEFPPDIRPKMRSIPFDAANPSKIFDQSAPGFLFNIELLDDLARQKIRVGKDGRIKMVYPIPRLTKSQLAEDVKKGKVDALLQQAVQQADDALRKWLPAQLPSEYFLLDPAAYAQYRKIHFQALSFMEGDLDITERLQEYPEVKEFLERNPKRIAKAFERHGTDELILYPSTQLKNLYAWLQGAFPEFITLDYNDPSDEDSMDPSRNLPRVYPPYKEQVRGYSYRTDRFRNTTLDVDYFDASQMGLQAGFRLAFFGRAIHFIQRVAGKKEVTGYVADDTFQVSIQTLDPAGVPDFPWGEVNKMGQLAIEMLPESMAGIAYQLMPHQAFPNPVTPRSELRKALRELIEAKVNPDFLERVLEKTVESLVRENSALDEIRRAAVLHGLKEKIYATLGAETGESPFAVGIDISSADAGLSQAFTEALRPGATAIWRGPLPDKKEITKRGAVLRTENMNRRIELAGEQPEVPVVLPDSLGRSLNQMFRPFYKEAGQIDPALKADVGDLANTLLSVAAVHYARILAAEPGLRLTPELLRAELLRRLQLFEDFPDIFKFGIGASGGVALVEASLAQFFRAQLRTAASA